MKIVIAILISMMWLSSAQAQTAIPKFAFSFDSISVPARCDASTKAYQSRCGVTREISEMGSELSHTARPIPFDDAGLVDGVNFCVFRTIAMCTNSEGVDELDNSQWSPLIGTMYPDAREPMPLPDPPGDDEPIPTIQSITIVELP